MWSVQWFSTVENVADIFGRNSRELQSLTSVNTSASSLGSPSWDFGNHGGSHARQASDHLAQRGSEVDSLPFIESRIKPAVYAIVELAARQVSQTMLCYINLVKAEGLTSKTSR